MAKFKVIDELSIFQEKMFESMFIKVSLNDNSNIIIGNIYRSPTNLNGITPSEQLDGFLEILSNILENLDELNCKVYLLGDFNIDLLKFNNHPKTSEFIDKFFSNGYLQLGLLKNGKRKTSKVHVLVGEAFIGLRTGEMTYDHIDRNNQNNRSDNLRLATKSEQGQNRNLLKNNKLGRTSSFAERRVTAESESRSMLLGRLNILTDSTL